MQNRKDVAEALGITAKRLCYILYGARERKNYRQFTIPKKSGGSRDICAPPRRLHWLQLQVYKATLPKFTPKKCVHGFAPGRSILTNALLHAGRRIVVNFDLKDFFPSIYFGRVKGVFCGHPFDYGDDAAKILAQICCTDEGVLPQGGVMSPLISNFVCRNLDNQLLSFASKHKLVYSRYADDITFSTKQTDLPGELIEFDCDRPRPGPIVRSIVEANSFEINLKKVRVRSKLRRQEVTGLTVNQFPNVPREFVRACEGALYALEKYGKDGAQRVYEQKYADGGGILIENVVRGRLSYLHMVRGKHDFLYRRLVRRFNRITSEPISLCALADAESTPLRSAPSSWETWFEKYRSEVFHLLFSLLDGTETGGTAFHLGGGLLATCRHNLLDDRGNLYLEHRLKVGGDRLVIQIDQIAKLQTSTQDVAAISLPDISHQRGIPTQLRLPQIGEEVAAIGFPTIPQRHPTLVMHVGTVEALPVAFNRSFRSIQVSFQSGGGLSGGCLIDRSGHVLGIMSQNVFMVGDPNVPSRPYGQAMPMEVFDDFLRG